MKSRSSPNGRPLAVCVHLLSKHTAKAKHSEGVCKAGDVEMPLYFLAELRMGRCRIWNLSAAGRTRVRVHFFTLSDRWVMPPDVESRQADRDDRAAGLPPVRDDGTSSRGAPLTMLELCRVGIIVVGCGMPFAVVFRRWVSLGLGLMVILILCIALVHERWPTRRRRRPVGSAPKRTRALRGSACRKGKASRRTGPCRAGKPGGKEASRRVNAGSFQPVAHGVPQAPPDQRSRGAAGEEEPPERMVWEETLSKEMD